MEIGSTSFISSTPRKSFYCSEKHPLTPERQRATVSFETPDGGQFVVSYDAPQQNPYKNSNQRRNLAEKSESLEHESSRSIVNKPNNLKVTPVYVNLGSALGPKCGSVGSTDPIRKGPTGCGTSNTHEATHASGTALVRDAKTSGIESSGSVGHSEGSSSVRVSTGLPEVELRTSAVPARSNVDRNQTGANRDRGQVTEKSSDRNSNDCSSKSVSKSTVTLKYSHSYKDTKSKDYAALRAGDGKEGGMRSTDRNTIQRRASLNQLGSGIPKRVVEPVGRSQASVTDRNSEQPGRPLMRVNEHSATDGLKKSAVKTPANKAPVATALPQRASSFKQDRVTTAPQSAKVTKTSAPLALPARPSSLKLDDPAIGHQSAKSNRSVLALAQSFVGSSAWKKRKDYDPRKSINDSVVVRHPSSTPAPVWDAVAADAQMHDRAAGAASLVSLVSLGSRDSGLDGDAEFYPVKREMTTTEDDDRGPVARVRHASLFSSYTLFYLHVK